MKLTYNGRICAKNINSVQNSYLKEERKRKMMHLGTEHKEEKNNVRLVSLKEFCI